MITVETFGLEDAISGLERLSPTIVEELTTIATAEGQRLLEDLRNYPGQRPPSSPYKVYIRGEGWIYSSGRTDLKSEQYGANVTLSADQRMDSLEITLSSGASYSIYIRGSLDENSEWYNRVAYMHTGNWEPAASIVERHIPAIGQAVDDTLTRVLQILGF